MEMSTKSQPTHENRGPDEAPYGFVYVGSTRVGYVTAPTRGSTVPDGDLALLDGNGGWRPPSARDYEEAAKYLRDTFGRPVHGITAKVPVASVHGRPLGTEPY